MTCLLNRNSTEPEYFFCLSIVYREVRIRPHTRSAFPDEWFIVFTVVDFICSHSALLGYCKGPCLRLWWGPLSRWQTADCKSGQWTIGDTTVPVTTPLTDGIKHQIGTSWPRQSPEVGWAHGWQERSQELLESWAQAPDFTPWSHQLCSVDFHPVLPPNTYSLTQKTEPDDFKQSTWASNSK